MSSYGSISLRKRTSRTTLIITCTALTVALYSTAETAYLFYSGDGTARRKIEQVYDGCLVSSARGSSVTEEDRLFAECVDSAIERIGGLYFAALVVAEGSGGTAYNFRSLTAALNRGRLECNKDEHKGDCSLMVFAINGCIAYGVHDASGHWGYGVGATKSEARHRMLTGSDVHSCGAGCGAWAAFCTARSSENR